MQLTPKNFAISTLASICLIDDDHVHITNPTLMNQGPGTFSLHVDNEIMLLTTPPTGDSFAAARAQEGTSAAEHSAGTKCWDSVTQARMQEWIDATLGAAPVGCISIFVASSTATAAEKALATPTYTCDGTADEVQINAALVAQS